MAKNYAAIALSAAVKKCRKNWVAGQIMPGWKGIPILTGYPTTKSDLLGKGTVFMWLHMAKMGILIFSTGEDQRGF